ncbi:MAG TPA: pyridoxamine 5'-phosphate oxidase family protein [Actinoallomurus sp.]|jgi:nitroimidazol reductase NimA-like FMN-containing flavoprotein (pyridoxamine 5'-phosphate oxidase superfamily)|nr:pyridoxamine 5'-phosphate oxidase family protein [Actinoallomurus sp.]
MRLDANGLEVLDRDDCLALMRSVTLGRVVFTDRALPAIQPVHFVFDGDDVIISMPPDSKLASGTRGAVVAFEADAFEPGSRSGWSVTVIGEARVVRLATEIERLSRLPLRSWAPGGLGYFIRIRGEYVSGRRIHPTYLEATR